MILERNIGDRNILDKFAEDFCSIVEKYCKYIVVSGFVAISHGRTRATEDIDLIIEKIDLPVFEKLHKNLVQEGFECLQSENFDILFNHYLKEGISIRYVRSGQMLPEMELKLSKDELDEMQIKTRVKLPLTGLNIYFSSIEMNIAFKEELLKSDKDMLDAKHLRLVYSEEINKEEINRIKELIKKLRLKEDGKNDR
jgi:hypothetical protein